MKGQSRLDFRKYSFSKRTVNEWNKLSANCAHSSSVNIMFKNRIENDHIDSYMWTLDKQTASLFAAIRVVAWIAMLLNFLSRIDV